MEEVGGVVLQGEDIDKRKPFTGGKETFLEQFCTINNIRTEREYGNLFAILGESRKGSEGDYGLFFVERKCTCRRRPLLHFLSSHPEKEGQENESRAFSYTFSVPPPRPGLNSWNGRRRRKSPPLPSLLLLNSNAENESLPPAFPFPLRHSLQCSSSYICAGVCTYGDVSYLGRMK